MTTQVRPSIARTALLTLPAQVAFRGIEALLPLFLVYWFGRSRDTDVYNYVFAVFSFAGSLVFSAYQDSALVPILKEERLLRPGGVPRLTGALLAYTWLVGGAIAVLVGAGAALTFAFRFEGGALSLALRMVVPFSCFLVAMSTRTFFSTLLAVEGRYVVQPVASCLGMVTNLGVVAALHGGIGVSVVPLGALAGELVASGLLGWAVVRWLGVGIRLCWDRPPALMSFSRLIVAEVGGGTVTRINPVVDQLMAGAAGVVGGGTLLRYSGDVATLPTSLLQAALLPVLLSHLSEDFAHRDLSRVRHTVVRSLAVVGAILVVASLGLWALAGPLLRAVFLHGQMDEAGVTRMIRIFPYHVVGLAPFGALLVLARAHVALRNSTIMVSMGLLNALSNIAFNVVLVRWIGLEGLALSTSCVHAVVAIVFWFRFESRLADLRQAAAIPS